MVGLTFDHAVINARYQMDQAQTCFEQLGFTLTDRGYHSLGSINHLMMFASDYLELIALPVSKDGEAATRAGISDAPLGLNGLVFKTDDAQGVFARLQQLGFAGDPPKSFSRPVDLPGGTQQARFTTVHVRPDVFPAGRVYFCEHATPELVWPEETVMHGNSATSIAQMVVVATDLNGQVQKFASLLQTDGRPDDDGSVSLACDGASVAILTPAAYARRYGDLAAKDSRDAFFGAIALRCRNLPALRAQAASWSIPKIDDAQRLVVYQPDFNCVLEFVPD